MMKLEVVTPERKIYDGDIQLIQLPGSKGSFEVLRNHAPLISTLDAGSIKIIDDTGETTYIEIDGGVVEVNNNHIVVLVEAS